MKKLITEKQAKKIKRNERIRFDFKTLTDIHGNTKMVVMAYIAKKEKISLHTVIAVIKNENGYYKYPKK